MEITTIGIDSAKSVFAVSAADESGRVVLRKQLRRHQVLEFLRAQAVRGRRQVGVSSTRGQRLLDLRSLPICAAYTSLTGATLFTGVPGGNSAVEDGVTTKTPQAGDRP